jgi:DNA-nicking Smr family endonuclease
MTRKSYEAPDQALWEDVKRSIKPLGVVKKRKANAIKATHQAGVILPRHVPMQMPTIAQAQRKLNHTPPPLAQMDRRTAQRLNRGQIEPEARLDLHGEGLETARIKLLHFLSSERHLGSRFVLVITGKGASPYARHTLHGTSHFHTPEREGRLRREVPLWLHEESFRLHAVGFQPAHPRHGGGGAFYVRLRKSGHHP